MCVNAAVLAKRYAEDPSVGKGNWGKEAVSFVRLCPHPVVFRHRCSSLPPEAQMLLIDWHRERLFTSSYIFHSVTFTLQLNS